MLLNYKSDAVVLVNNKYTNIRQKPNETRSDDR